MKKIIFSILIIPAALILIWFKDGYLLGASEDGLIFYNTSAYFHQAQFTWMEYPGLGSPSVMLIAGKPTYFFLSFLQNLGIPGFLLQAGVFYFLIISAGIGVYLLVCELFPKLPKKYVFLSIFFYWFNPIALSSILSRSLLNYFFFYSAVPIATYFYIKGLRSGRYFWVLALNLFLLFFSYIFSYLAFSILLWFWFLITTIYFALFFNHKTFTIKYLFLSAGLFIVCNCWWILPLIILNVSGGARESSQSFLQQTNLDTLTAISKSIGNLSGIFKLINTSSVSVDSLNWAKLYYSPVLFITQYFFIGVVLLFIIKNRKERVILFLGSLFLTIIFLAKGNNPPFGEIYQILFKKIPILQIFRNPFEKFAFLLSLITSIFVGPSIFFLIFKLKSNLKKLAYLLILFFLCVYLGFPLYSGLALTNTFPPTNDYSIGYRVKVPGYYKELFRWLSSNGDNFRYIGLPLAPEGITYKWEKGYTGLELPVALFDSKAILLNTTTSFFDQIISQTEKTLLSDENFYLLSNLLNARYYLLRYDIDYQSRAMINPLILDKSLLKKEKKGEVKKIASFGKISIWENLKWRDSKFYPANEFIKIKNFDNDTTFTSIDVLRNEVLIDFDDSLKLEKLIKNRNEGLPEVSYKKISTTRYIVQLKNVKNPFLLVFSELYNDGWKASVNSRELNNHMRVNLYANGWEVDEKGDFEVIVEFAPQKWMNVGQKISIIAGTLTVLLLFFMLKFKKAL